MSTLRPYGAWVLFYVFNYKHCVPTGLVLSRGRSWFSNCYVLRTGERLSDKCIANAVQPLATR